MDLRDASASKNCDSTPRDMGEEMQKAVGSAGWRVKNTGRHGKMSNEKNCDSTSRDMGALCQ